MYLKRGLMKGIASITSALLAFSISGTMVLYDNEGVVNSYLNISTGAIVNPENTEGDLQYYKSAYGDGALSAENLALLIGDTYQQNVAESEEGSVLMKNDNHALPLTSDERSVDLFGEYVDSPVDMGSGEFNIDLKTALKNESFKIDASDSKVAIVMLSRTAGEGTELKMVNADGISSLALQNSEKELLRSIKTSGKYKKIIALINSSNAIEMDWAYSSDYGVDAVLWIGGTGLRGFSGVVNLRMGKVSPSGKLTDVYASDSTSAPACVNGSTNISRWKNIDYLRSKSTEIASSIAYYNVQVEGIYVGYKYYETRYEDCVLQRYGARSSVGSSTGNAWNYSEEVTYPFGYGLSYTTFEQTLLDVTDSGENLSVTVKVKNTGTTAGKSVVQIYAQTPYGDYERENLVEKSAVQLVGFDKTRTLAVGEEQTLTIDIDKYFLASYDYVNAKGYILSEGQYFIAIGDDCHDALNNILAAKNCTNLLSADGKAVIGNADNTYSWREDTLDTQSYAYANNTKVSNLFDDCDINYWIDDAVTYLSRQDWQSTYPQEQVNLSITDEMIEVLNGDTYTTPTDAPNYTDFVQGAENGITAFDMMGVSYDDEKWKSFIDQMSVGEMASLLAGGFSKEQITSIVLPSYFSGDGIDYLHSSFSAETYGNEYARACCRYANQIVLASTWNSDLCLSRGQLMGEEMLFCGYFQIYGPGADLHRTPFGGRNKEYCSEDSILTYMVTTDIVKGCEEKGVSVQIKHLAGNDQEYNRQGLCTFFTEQAWREGSLRAFEGAMTVGGAGGCMNGLNRIGLRWTNASEALCKGVLRKEWGFCGIIGSDGIASNYQTHFTTTVAAGTDSFCLDSKGKSSATIEEYLRTTKDGYMLSCLRDAAKHNLYVLVNSSVMNGLTHGSRIDYQACWWKETTTACIVVFSVLTVASVALYVFFWIKDRKNQEGQENEKLSEE
jgi:beta-glucosidase